MYTAVFLFGLYICIYYVWNVCIDVWRYVVGVHMWYTWGVHGCCVGLMCATEFETIY